jgi:hypothetical protein
MNEAYATHDARARRLFDNLARRLEGQHPGAAASDNHPPEIPLPDAPIRLQVLAGKKCIENLVFERHTHAIDMLEA